MKGNKMKKVQVHQQKKFQTKIKRKTPEQRSSNQKYSTLSKYQTNIVLRGLKFTPTPKRNKY